MKVGNCLKGNFKEIKSVTSDNKYIIYDSDYKNLKSQKKKD